MKLCLGCDRTLPLSAFRLKAKGSTQVRSRCKECSNTARRASRASASPVEKNRALALARQWKQDNRERNQAQKGAWESANPARVTAYSKRSQRKWRSANADAARKRVLASRAKRPDYYRAIERAWALANPGKCRAKYKRYMCAKQNAVPSWVNGFIIGEVYRCCAERNALRTGGVQWHVDHVVPLQSDLVCGLHVHENLQVIPSRMNISKGNRFWPDMP